jgi:acyl-CoA thioesterase FadM
VETRLTDVRSRTVTFDYVITNAVTGTRLVTAATRLASVDAKGTTVVMPREIRALLEQAAARDCEPAPSGAV